MRVVVDLGLPPGLVPGLVEAGNEAVHWSQVGDPKALDVSIAQWAKDNGYIILTHDLDFGDLLFASNDHSPSVIIVREKDTATEHILDPVIRVLTQFEQELRSGALIAMTNSMARVRRLPLR
jgi:predicted nuclease of predicted toxin-antitoxin system